MSRNKQKLLVLAELDSQRQQSSLTTYMETTMAWKTSLAPTSAEQQHLLGAAVTSQLQCNPNILHLVPLHES